MFCRVLTAAFGKTLTFVPMTIDGMASVGAVQQFENVFAPNIHQFDGT